MMKRVAPTWYVQLAPLSAESSTTTDIREDVKSASQERMKRELAAYFQDVSRVRPLVLFVEDLHWADASTVDVLNYLAGRFDSMRVLVLVTYRPSDMAVARHPFLPVARQLQAANALIECPLDHLDRADVDRYLELEFPGHSLPPSFVTLIHEKTEGHPLFMVDLLRYLRDRGDVVSNGGRWNLSQTTADVARELPETVKGTIGRKIDRLDELDRRLLTVASVQGHEFDTAIVSDVLALDPADVEDRFAALDQIHRLVQAVRTYELPDRALSVRYRFAHVLYQNVLYASLQPTRRASFARKVAQALLTHHGTETPALAAELALLFETSRDAGAAAQYLLAGCPPRHAHLRLPGSALALGAWPGRGRRHAGRTRAHAAGARTAHGERLRPAIDDRVGDTGDRADIRARTAALSRSRGSTAGVPGALGDCALPPDSRQSAGVPRPRRRADGHGARLRHGAPDGGGTPHGGRGARVHR